MIPADFPNVVLSVGQANKLSHLKAKLLSRFNSTLSDDLNPEPMRCLPMSISLQDDATPTCVTTARRVPKHYEPESKKTVAELIDRGVITPVDEPTTWCSPAFFVPKADGKRVRLVTNFTALNKFVRRPTHPFPSTREIIEAIPRKQSCSANWTQCTAISSWHSMRGLASSRPFSSNKEIQIPQGPYGPKCVVRRMVQTIGYHNSRSPIRNENRR